MAGLSAIIVVFGRKNPSTPNGWSLGAWVKNIEDEDVQAVIGLGPVPGAAGPSLAFLQPPRTFGLRFTYDL